MIRNHSQHARIWFAPQLHPAHMSLFCTSSNRTQPTWSWREHGVAPSADISTLRRRVARHIQRGCTWQRTLQSHSTATTWSQQSGHACMGSINRCRVGHSAPTCSETRGETQTCPTFCLICLLVLLPIRSALLVCPCLAPACMGATLARLMPVHLFSCGAFTS